MKNIKRVLAIAVVVLLLGMYLWALIAALLAKPGAGGIFNAAIFCTVFFPVLLYVYMWTAQWLKGRGADKRHEAGETESGEREGGTEAKNN